MAGLTGLDTRWLVRWRPVPDPPLRLFCLPHTGGGALAYRDWADRLAPGVEVVAVRLPGREARFREPAFRRLDRLVPALLDAVEPWLDRPHAWFGHSMGALIAFEACRALRHRTGSGPVQLLVSGHRAPHLPARERPVHDAPAAAVLDRLRELGGTPPEVLADRAAMAILLPMLRADFAVAETYRHRPEPPLDCPISVLGGAADPMTTAAELSGWRRHSHAGGTVRIFDGGHFFLHQDLDRVLPVIEAETLLAVPRGRPH